MISYAKGDSVLESTLNYTEEVSAVLDSFYGIANTKDLKSQSSIRL